MSESATGRPEEAEDTLRLYVDEGLTQQEIAERLGSDEWVVGEILLLSGVEPDYSGPSTLARKLSAADASDVGEALEAATRDDPAGTTALADLRDAHTEEPERARALLASVDEHRAAVYAALREGGEQGMGELRSRYAGRVENPRSDKWIRSFLRALATIGVAEYSGVKRSRTYRLTGGDCDAE